MLHHGQKKRFNKLSPAMHPPGVEPGARPWEDPMLPLHHECIAKGEAGKLYMVLHIRVQFYHTFAHPK